MISFVYFDLGGVAELDFSGTNKWEEMLSDMGVNQKNRDAFDTIWKSHKNRICLDVDVDTLIPLIERECKINFPHGYSWLEDFVNRFEQNRSIWPVIDEFHKTAKIGLLTNVYPRMYQSIMNHNLLPPVEWDVIVDSSVVGYQKPDRKIFELAQDLSKTNGDEILYVENSPEHVKAAKAFGWNVFLYDSSNPEKSSKFLLKYFIDR